MDVKIEAKELKVAFTYSSFIASELQIDEVNLSEGEVELKIFKKDDKETILRNLKTREIFADYESILSQIPVQLNIVTLNKVHVEVDETALFINSASFSPQRKRARLKADVSNLYVGLDNSEVEDLKISSIQILGSMEKEEWRVDNLKVVQDQTVVEMRGVAFNQDGVLNLNSSGNFKLSPEEVLSYLKTLPADIASIKGLADGKFETTGVIDDPNATVTFNAQNVDTEWIKLKAVSGVVTKKRNLLAIQKLNAVNGSESYTLLRPQNFYDLKVQKFTNFNFNLRLNNAFTDTFLFAVKDSLGTLKGNLTGDVDISLYDDKAVFNIKNKVSIKNFRLTNSDGKNNILKNNGFDLDNSIITINSDYSVGVDIKASMANTRILAKGKISDKGIDITTTDSKIDMKALGPISGIDISGSGPASVKVSGALDDVTFFFNVDWNDFSVVDLNFGKVKADFSLGLKELVLNINSLDGNYNKTNFSATGTLGFDGPKEGMNLKIDFKNSTFSDSRKMLNLVFKNIKLPVDPEFNFAGTFLVKGGYDLNKLVVDGQIRGSDLKVSGEEAEKISLDFSLAKSQLHMKDIKIVKSRGELNANVNINLVTDYIDLSGGTKALRLRDFNFYKNLKLEYDGDLFLDFDGNGTTKDFSSKFKARVANAFIGNMPASSSNAIFYINSNDIVTNASLLGNKIKVDSLMSFNTGIAAIKASIDTNDLREFLGVFSSHNMADKGITGKIKAQLNTQISTGSMGVRKFLLNVDQFNLKRGDINFNIDPRYNTIEVDGGIVKKWDVRLRDGSEFIISKGRNISNGVIALEHRFALKASLLEIAAGQIEKATGRIRGTDLIILDKKLTIKDFSLYGDDHSIKIKGVPGYITNFNFTIIKKGEAFEVTRMNGEYGEGEFKVGGKLTFNTTYPDIALNYQIDRATVPLFKRSNVMVSSNGTLTGSNLPYKLNGKLTIMHGEFLDDPADFMKDDKVTIDEYKKYLPEKNFLGNKAIIDLNVAFDTANPVVIKNNMAEVYIRGNGQVTGDIQAPELNTRLEIVPNVSKFKFKGHDFALSQGYVEIRDRGKNRLSDLKFTGVAKISDYDMKLDLSGSISKVNIDLSSEPALSKEDLLSLLTLGVTSDMSKNLEASERRFVTTVGIGTLLVDQLKINEDLNESLGVKLSVQPEFEENESTLISGKAAMSDGSTSRLKSATKIKINKKINNRVDVSLSSTIGGSLEQKQEMNINLNINKNFSLEGIYEVKPTEDENTTTPNSLGADLKWRKSF